MSEAVVEVITTGLEVIEIVEAGPAGPPGAPGPQGPQGDVGPMGPQGPPDLFRYVHDQAMAATDWTVTHNLDGYPSVTVVDSAGTKVEGQVVYTSNNELTVSFNAAFAGTVYLS